MTELTCYSCLHSKFTVRAGCLLCLKTGQPAVKRCEDFVYEPGTDECERGKS